MADTSTEWGNYCFRQHPSASVDIRGQPRFARAEDGNWGTVRAEEGGISLSGGKLERSGRIIDTVSFLGLPSASADVHCLRGRKMEAVKLLGKRGADT